MEKDIDTKIGKRISFLIKEMNMSNNQFSKKMKISTSVTHNIVNGTNNPSYLFLIKLISLNRNIDINWLITGNYSNHENKNMEKEFLYKKNMSSSISGEKKDLILKLLEKIVDTQDKTINVQDSLISNIENKSK